MHLDETKRVDVAAIALAVFGVLLVALGRVIRAVDDNLAELSDLD